MHPCQELRVFFETGTTRSFAFRKKQLEKLREGIAAHEEELFAALKEDLGKSAEETWITENGMVLSELRYAIRKLGSWMKPEKRKTNLLNFPSRSYVLREPLGVVLIIGPWNYPFQLLFNPLVGAITAGNCVVLKPSEFTPATNAVMKKILLTGPDPRQFVFLEGNGAEVLPPLFEAFRFDHVFFTGSTNVGREIYRMAANALTPVTLELGGKSPCVVEKDAQIQVAARRIAITKFSNAGQMCVAPDYVLVDETIQQPFLEALRKTVRDFFGEKAEESYSYARIISEKHFRRLNGFLRETEAWYGGRTNPSELFIEPTIVVNPPPGATFLEEEIFGPILPVIGFRDRASALQVIRRHAEPLAFYVYTSSAEAEKFWLEQVPAGGTCINNSSWHLTNHHLPFGGRGPSGMGHYHGKYSFDTFSHLRAVLKTPTWFDPALKYPPFEGKLKWYKKFLG
jgi:aldehyde dehydrogenase (NAD+)